MGPSASDEAPSPEPLAGDGIAHSDTLDYTSSLPDALLSLIFHSFSAATRNRCSLVCNRWLTVDGRSRRHLSLDANAEISPHIPSLFSRFDSVTHLTLNCPLDSPSLADDDLLSISVRCPDLSSLKLVRCHRVSDVGIASLAHRCKNLTSLHCSYCSFGINGFNSVFQHCCMLEDLSVIEQNCTDPDPKPQPRSSKSLKSIRLQDLKDGELFAPLIIGATSLRKLELLSCVGDWDVVLESMVSSNDRLVDIRLRGLSQLTDAALLSISNCASLEVLHALLLPNCTSLGIASVAERCMHLRQVFISTRANQIGDEGFASLGRNCRNLQELCLFNANPSIVGLEEIASRCLKLKSLVLGCCDTICDSELSFLAGKCKALESLAISRCPVSDVGLTALFSGFPKLREVLFMRCVEVSRDMLHELKRQREPLHVRLCSGNDKLWEEITGTSNGALPCFT